MSIKISERFKTHIVEKCKKCKKMFWVRRIKKFTHHNTKDSVKKVVILCPDCRLNTIGKTNYVSDKVYKKYLKKHGCTTRTMTKAEKKKYNLKT